jgi:hypothetical protein
MTRARGQSSSTPLDRNYPHQVLVLAQKVAGKALDKVTAFHAKLGVPVKTHSIRKDDRWYLHQEKSRRRGEQPAADLSLIIKRPQS